MRTISRIALIFGVLNLFFGITGFISPLVTKQRSFFPWMNRNPNKWINTQPGEQFGLFATNWVHSLMHIILGIPALIPAVRNRFARVYLGALAANYAMLSAMGFMDYGMKSGVHTVMGQAQNREDSLLNSVLALAGLLFVLRPDMKLGRLPSVSQIQDSAEEVVDRATRKVHKQSGEKMPV
jgi:hypothetical protein